jgi:hypothetical protein
VVFVTQDEQDNAEAFDEEMIDGDENPTSEHEIVQFPAERLRGVPFADSDVTDESVVDRHEQEVPEVAERDIDERDADGLTEGQTPELD